MISRIQKDFTFQTAVHFNDKFMINLYEMNTIMSINSTDAREQNIAVERMTHFLNHVMEDCIFVCHKEKEAIENYTKAGLRVATIPEDPYDQIVGCIILNKCNAIMEGRIKVTDLIIGSKLSNLIKFELNDDTAELEFGGKHWWNEPNLNIEAKKTKKEKIVKLSDIQNNWEELELTWKA